MESSRDRCCKFNKGLPQELVEAVKKSQVLCAAASGSSSAAYDLA